MSVSKQAVANWRSRDSTFPAPLAELRSGPVWRLEDIAKWAAEHSLAIKIPEEGEELAAIQCAKTVSVVNMKGGVGKSTLTANLGWSAALQKQLRVLLVDLDPQFNLSQYILGSRKYEAHLDASGKTVLDILEQGNPATTNGFAPKEAIVQVVKPWGKSPAKLDLVPSSLQLSWTLRHGASKEFLANFIEDVKAAYDLVLIDCAPTDSILTDAAYLSSDYLLVPVRPEYLSTIGLPLLMQSKAAFERAHPAKSLEILGVVFNATQEKQDHDRARAYVREVSSANGWYVFRNEVTFSDSYPKGSREGKPIFRTDYARYNKIQDMAKVAQEFFERLGF
jgi:chromosome partitioning protein